MKKLKLVLSLLLAGCSTIDYNNKVDGWPLLKTHSHYLSSSVLRSKCSQYVSAFQTAIACTEFYLPVCQCHIFYDASYNPQWVKEHEEAHCEGYDHLGSTHMQEMLKEFKSKNPTWRC